MLINNLCAFHMFIMIARFRILHFLFFWEAKRCCKVAEKKLINTAWCKKKLCKFITLCCFLIFSSFCYSIGISWWKPPQAQLCRLSSQFLFNLSVFITFLSYAFTSYSRFNGEPVKACWLPRGGSAGVWGIPQTPWTSTGSPLRAFCLSRWETFWKLSECTCFYFQP